MRWSALLLVPLFVVACDREPVAPSVGDGPVFGSASSEWEEVVFSISEGLSWGPVPCLPGKPEAVYFGSGTVRFHYVTTPGGDVRVIWSYPALSDDTRLEIAGETWTIKKSVRHGMDLYDPEWTQGKSVEGNTMFENQVTGVVLNWPIRWHFSFNANGELTVAFVHEACRVTH